MEATKCHSDLWLATSATKCLERSFFRPCPRTAPARGTRPRCASCIWPSTRHRYISNVFSQGWRCRGGGRGRGRAPSDPFPTLSPRAPRPPTGPACCRRPAEGRSGGRETRVSVLESDVYTGKCRLWLGRIPAKETQLQDSKLTRRAGLTTRHKRRREIYNCLKVLLNRRFGLAYIGNIPIRMRKRFEVRRTWSLPIRQKSFRENKG